MFIKRPTPVLNKILKPHSYLCGFSFLFLFCGSDHFDFQFGAAGQCGNLHAGTGGGITAEQLTIKLVNGGKIGKIRHKDHGFNHIGEIEACCGQHGGKIFEDLLGLNLNAHAAEGNLQVSSAFQMILDILPSNLLDPFLSGNTMQIIVIATAIGIVLLMKSNQCQQLIQCIGQTNSVVQHLVTWISSLIPVLIFVSILKHFWLGDLAAITQLWKPFLLFSCITLGFLLCILLYTSLRLKVSFPLLIKKMFPTFLIGLSTASSAAAYSTNTDCCQFKLGIDSSLTKFGTSVGIVIYMPSTVFSLLVVSAYCAYCYNVEISIFWLVMAVCISAILAIAAPPIPGGALTCFTVLFLQLGIPTEALVLAMTLDMLIDFVSTACNQTYLQAALIVQGKQLDMLDIETLRRKN